MLTSSSDDLDHVLRAFSPALKTIDIRTFAVCPDSHRGFQNLITSITISDKTVAEVRAEHKQISEVKTDKYTLYCDVVPFDKSIFELISQGQICFPILASIQFPVFTRKFNPLSLKVSSIVEWINDSRHILLKATDQGDSEERKILWDVVHKQKNFNRFGFRNFQDFIQHYLKLANFNFDVTKDFEITILPLAKIGDTQFLEEDVKINIQNPHQLTKLQLNFELHPKQTWMKPQSIGSKDHIDVKIKELLPLSDLHLRLIHRDSGLTLDRTEIKVPLENVTEPFLKALYSFCPIDEFRKMLFEPEITKGKPQFNFESAVAWLLSLAGFNAIHLNSSRKTFDTLRVGGGYEKGCSDIIAYEENERLLLIDCDTSSVDPTKVQKLARTKEHFREKLKGYEKLHIVPILFTPIDFRKASPSHEVMIADRAVIKRVFEAVVKGNREEARGYLRYSGY